MNDENERSVASAGSVATTWCDEAIAVFDAFDRCGIPRQAVLSDDEPDQIIPMVNAMANEISRLRITDAERDAVSYYVGTGGPDGVDAALRGLLERHK